MVIFLQIHFQSLTARPWKMRVGRLLSFWKITFQGRTVKLQVGIMCSYIQSYIGSSFPWTTWIPWRFSWFLGPKKKNNDDCSHWLHQGWTEGPNIQRWVESGPARVKNVRQLGYLPKNKSVRMRKKQLKPPPSTVPMKGCILSTSGQRPPHTYPQKKANKSSSKIISQ